MEENDITTMESMMVLDNVKENQNVYCVESTYFGHAMQIHMDTHEELAQAPVLAIKAFRPGRGEVKIEDVILMWANPFRMTGTALGIIRGVLGDEHRDLVKHVTGAVFGELMAKYGLTPEEAADLVFPEEEEDDK